MSQNLPVDSRGFQERTITAREVTAWTKIMISILMVCRLPRQNRLALKSSVLESDITSTIVKDGFNDRNLLVMRIKYAKPYVPGNHWNSWSNWNSWDS